MNLVISKCVTAVKVSNFSGHYLRNRSTLDIGVLDYIGIVQHKEHSPEVWHIPPGTLCINIHIYMYMYIYAYIFIYIHTYIAVGVLNLTVRLRDGRNRIAKWCGIQPLRRRSSFSKYPNKKSRATQRRNFFKKLISSQQYGRLLQTYSTALFLNLCETAAR